MIKIEAVQEIWRTPAATFVVMYPFPEIAFVKGLRGHYSKNLRAEIRKCMLDRNIQEVHYERLKNGELRRFKIKVK